MTTVRSTGWIGWVVFAGVILMLNGLFSIVQGFIAVIGPDAYYSVSEGSLWLFDVAGWGWWNITIGVFLGVVAFAVFAGQPWARVVAIILVIVSGVGHLLLIPAQPWWSLIMIAIDVLVIYALIVHGREAQEVM